MATSFSASTPGYAATTSAECSRDEMPVPVLEAAMPQPVTKKPRKKTTPSVENNLTFVFYRLFALMSYLFVQKSIKFNI
jgi:hypothetical protein